MQEIGAAVGSFLVHSARLTMRVYHYYRNREETESLLRSGKRIIFCFWHGRLLMMPFACSIRNAAIMISQHRDGNFVSRFAERLGFQSIRGSTTRGSLAALKSMVNAHRSGLHLVITPDGPRGPGQEVKPGVIELGKLTGSPIQPVTFGASPRRVMDSWDHFVVPLPFSVCVFVWGNPLWVPPEADKEKMASLREKLQEEMREITALADDLSRELATGRRYRRRDVEAEPVGSELRKASD
jgi:lysophospholipid acyltransferase (LPLAT)-like uncharacterized protein